MKKKKEEQLCLFQPSYEELVSWDGMESISPCRLKRLMNRFCLKNTQKKKGSKHMTMKHYAWMMAVSLMCLPLAGCWDIEKGEKTGQIVDVWQSGLLIKTWECKLIRGGLDDGNGTFGQSIQLTLENEDQLQQAKECMRKKSPVVVSYHKELVSFLRSDSNSLFLDRIDDVSGKPKLQGEGISL